MKVNPESTSSQAQETMWDELGKLETESDDIESPETEIAKPLDEIEHDCKELFGRSRDGLARELQVLGLIDGYKRWGLEGENREIHQQILEAQRDGLILGKNEPGGEDAVVREFNPDGTLRKMTVKLRDGRVLTEERTYKTTEPTFDFEHVDEYIQDGVISNGEAVDIAYVYKVLMGEDLPDNIDTDELRRSVGDTKEKIIKYYNAMYRKELFHDDGADREGLSHEVVDGDIPVVRFSGADFKMLVHVRNAMSTAAGEKNGEDLLVDDPRQEWMTPREGHDYIPRGLSTTLVSNEKISIFRNSEIVFGFNNLEENSIVSMSEEDAGSSISAHSRYGIVGNHGNERLMPPDELIEKTGTAETLTNYNEVMLDRMAGDKLIMPSCLIVFGNDVNQITELQKHHARSFGIPIYLIDDTKYGGVRVLGDKVETTE